MGRAAKAGLRISIAPSVGANEKSRCFPSTALLAFLTAITATALGLAQAAVVTWFVERTTMSDGDLIGFGGALFTSTMIIAVSLYAPTAFWLCAARQSTPAVIAAACATLANVPVFAALAWGWAKGFLAGPSEVFLFASAYIVSGAVFGWGYWRLARSRAV